MKFIVCWSFVDAVLKSQLLIYADIYERCPPPPPPQKHWNRYLNIIYLFMFFKKKTCNFEIYTFVKKIELTLFYTTFFEAYTKQNLSKFVPISFCKTCYFLLFIKCIAIFVTSTLPLPKHKYADSILLLGRGPRQGDDFLKIMRNRQKCTKKCVILHKYVINLIFC